jgi:hypothetical protein
VRRAIESAMREQWIADLNDRADAPATAGRVWVGEQRVDLLGGSQ